MADQLVGWWVASGPAVALARRRLARAGAGRSIRTRSIKLVVPYPPGALTDLARAVDRRAALARRSSEPVVIDNKPGAGTLVGAEFVAKQPPDGYTLLMATQHHARHQSRAVPAVAHQSGAGLRADRAGRIRRFLPDRQPRRFPAKNVREMIDAIKRAPGKYNYASVGSGSPHHLFMEALKTEYGLDIQHVPYKGTSAAISDLLDRARCS